MMHGYAASISGLIAKGLIALLAFLELPGLPLRKAASLPRRWLKPLFRRSCSATYTSIPSWIRPSCRSLLPRRRAVGEPSLPPRPRRSAAASSVVAAELPRARRGHLICAL